MIDVHAHINHENFPSSNMTATNDGTATKKTFSDLLAAAKSANVNRIVSVSENIHDVHHILELAEQSNGLIKPGVGLHPVQRLDADNPQERSVTLKDLEQFEPIIKENITKKTLCCVGESNGIFVYIDQSVVTIKQLIAGRLKLMFLLLLKSWFRLFTTYCYNQYKQPRCF